MPGEPSGDDASMVNTFATVYRKVDQSLVACCVEVSPPKHDIFAAGFSCQRGDSDLSIGFCVQSIVTSIQDSSIPVVRLEWDVRCHVIGDNPTGVVEARLYLR